MRKIWFLYDQIEYHIIYLLHKLHGHVINIDKYFVHNIFWLYLTDITIFKNGYNEHMRE